VLSIRLLLLWYYLFHSTVVVLFDDVAVEALCPHIGQGITVHSLVPDMSHVASFQSDRHPTANTIKTVAYKTLSPQIIKFSAT
jgi:hypothetical protein